MKISACDWSMTTPAITIFEDGKYEFHYCTSNKKHAHTFTKYNIFGAMLLVDWKTQEQRFDALSSWAMDIIGLSDIVYIEDYAFAARGKVFNIGECAGLLKHRIWKSGMHLKAISPTEIKKYATGKGTAKKPQMIEKFIEITGIDLYGIYGLCETSKNLSPIADIADSFFVCKCGMENYNVG